MLGWAVVCAAASAQENPPPSNNVPPATVPGRASAQAAAGPPAAIRYIEKEIYVPVPSSFPRGLDALEVYANSPGRHPLALLTHGTSNEEGERQHVTPWVQLGQALWFARRGYVAIVIVRKGYGKSGGKRDGKSGGCSGRGSFREAGEASAEDLRQVAKWAASLPEVDAATLVSAGVSTGGFAQVALSADPPKNLKAAISFAGGRCGDGKEHNCDLGGVVGAFRDFGRDAAKHGSVPMLWIYSQNDHWFPPSMAAQFEDAYNKAGGAEQFILAPPDGDDGHHLFAHVDAWSAIVGAFLKERSLLPLGDEVLPPPAVADVPPPPGLHENGLAAWQRFLGGTPFKAFATTGSGGWGSAAGQFDQALADQKAIDNCRKAVHGADCQIVARTASSKEQRSRYPVRMDSSESRQSLLLNPFPEPLSSRPASRRRRRIHWSRGSSEGFDYCGETPEFASTVKGDGAKEDGAY